MSLLEISKRLFNPLFRSNLLEDTENTQGDLDKTIEFIGEYMPNDIQILFTPEFLIVTDKGKIMTVLKDRVCVIDNESGKLLNDFKISRRNVTGITVVDLLYYADKSGVLTGFDWRTGKIEFELQVSDEKLSFLKADNDLLYMASQGKVITVEISSKIVKEALDTSMTIKCFDVHDGKIVAGGEKLIVLNYQLFEIACESVVTAISCQEDLFTVGFTTGAIVSYNYSYINDEVFPLRVLKGHKGPVTCIVPYKNLLLTGGSDFMIRVWNIYNQQEKLIGHIGNITSLHVINNRIYSASVTNRILSWKLPNFQAVYYIPQPETVLQMQISGNFLALLYDTGYISIFSLDTYLKIGDLHYPNALSFRFSKNGRFLLTSHPSEVLKWELPSLKFESFHIDINIVCICDREDDFLLGSQDGEVWIVDSQIPNKVIDTFKLLPGPINYLCYYKDLIFSSSLFAEISCYDCEADIEKSLVGHTSPISFLGISELKKYLVSASGSMIRIWSIRILSCVRVLSLLSPIKSIDIQSNLLYVATGKKVTMIDQMTWTTVGCVKSPNDLIRCTDMLWVALNGSQVCITENPITSKTIRVYGESSHTYEFITYISKLIKSETAEYFEKITHFFISPFLFNITHIYSLFNFSKLLDLALQNQAPFAHTRRNESPLSLSLSKNFTSCVTVIFKNISKRLKENPYFLLRSQETLAELNQRGDQGLESFYQSLLFHDQSSHLPTICPISQDLPDLKYKKSFECRFQNEDQLKSNKPIVFYHSVIKLPTTGSQQSLLFLESLTACPNSAVFESDFLEFLLKKKWEEVKKYLFFQAGLYLLYLVLITVYTVFFMDSGQLLIPIFIVNFVFSIYEIFQMYAGKHLYWEDFWNYIDICRSIMVVGYCFIVFNNDGSDDERGGILVVINLLSWIRGVNYFRLFHRTRVMVNLIKEVCKDMFSFLIIFFYSTLAFAFIYFALEDADSENLTDYLVESYKLNLADYDTTDYNLLEWIVFFTATMGNTVIMLNLLICILFDTYDRVKANSLVTDRKEITQLVLEGEITMFTRRNIQKEKHLHVILDQEIVKEQGFIESKLQNINKNVKKVAKFAEDVKNNNEATNEKVKLLEEKIVEMAGTLARIEAKLSR